MAERTNDALFALARDLRAIVSRMLYSADRCKGDLDDGPCHTHDWYGEGKCPHPEAAKLLKVSEAILDAPEPDDMDVCNLSGQDLLDALTEAYSNGHYKGWTFSDISRGGSVLPMTVYDEKQDSRPITKHEAVVMIGGGRAKVRGITIATTTSKGTVFTDYLPI